MLLFGKSLSDHPVPGALVNRVLRVRFLQNDVDFAEELRYSCGAVESNIQ
ncbi:MAG: hypothetical protein IKU17_02670 [Clostridia bacterium]|nr:hypothetical protein [Clostridia bacterium]